MSRWELAARRLGGPDAVTWPLFWVSFVMSTGANFAFPPVPIPLPARLTSLVVAQLAMFVPLVVLRRGLLDRSSRPHPWWVLLTYLVATVIRAYVLTTMLRVLDSAHDVPFLTRLQGSVASTFIVFVLTTLVVSTSREHARDQARLVALREELLQTREAVAGQIEERNEAALARVQATLVAELASLESVSDDHEALEALRRLSADVVRPMSHELEQSVPSWQPQSVPATALRVDWPQVLSGLGSRGPFLPLLTAMLITLFVGIGTATYLRDRAAAIVAISILGTPAMLWLANRVLDRLLPLTTRGRSLVLVVVVGVVACALPAAAVAAVSASPTAVVLGFAGTVFLSALTLLMAVAREVFAVQRNITAELAASTQELRVSLVRLHQAQWYHQRALARALHGAMQTAVVAAAIRLDDAMHEGTVSDELLDGTRADLAREVDVLSASAEQPKALDDFVGGLESVWSRVADVEVAVESAAREAVENDPVLRAIVIEVTSEIVSNAVRHGHASRVELALRQPREDTLELVSTSDSTVDSGPRRRGLGSRLLDDCTLEWHERSNDQGLEITAAFPVMPERAAATSPTHSA